MPVGTYASAVHIAVAACTDVIAHERFNNFTDNGWVLAGGTATIVSGRTGTSAQMVTNQYARYTIPSLSESDTLTIGFAYRATVVTAAQRKMVELFSDTNTNMHLSLRHEGSDGMLRVYRGASTVFAASATGIIVNNTWQYVEMQAKLHDTTGFVKVRVNGVEVINLTGDTKEGGTKTTFDTVRLGVPTISNTNQYDDLYISMGSACAFKGDPYPVQPVMTDLLMWHDADDFVTFTFSSGTVVSNWRHKLSSTFFFGQATVAQRPSRSGTQNGNATVVFGSGHNLTTGSPVVSAITDNLTLFVACKRTGGGVQSVVFMMGQSTNGYGLAMRANSANVGLLRGNILMHSTATPDPAAPCVLALRRTAGTWSSRLNGVATDLATTAAPSAPASNTLMASAAHPFEGEIYEVLFYTRALSDAERAQNETYLRTKWGTP